MRLEPSFERGEAEAGVRGDLVDRQAFSPQPTSELGNAVDVPSGWSVNVNDRSGDESGMARFPRSGGSERGMT